MKQFENKNGNFMVSRDVEIDTDDLVGDEETKQDKTLKEIKEKVNKLTQPEEDNFPSKSNCLVHLYFTEDKKISGTFESYKKFYKSSVMRGCGNQAHNWEARQVTLWVGYDGLASYFKGTDEERIRKITIEHIAGHEQLIVENSTFWYGDFEIIEINGPLFKIRLELLHVV